MKKFVVFFAVMFMAAACATPPNNTATAPNLNANANANVATATSNGPLSEADAIAKEKATWDTIKKKDWTGFADMLASDYIEIGSDGVYDKNGLLTFVKDLDVADVEFSDWKSIPIDADATILTYTLNLKGTHKGQPIPAGPYRATAAWVNRAGKWVALYYQETLAKAAPSPAASPGASPQMKPAASPQMKPAASPTSPMAAGSDPEANEKMVWDAIKSKNSDAFASFLASDFIEVEDDGVYDKAGSVKGITMFDASKAVLSDWKTVKIDNDAALVTYMVKLPAPMGAGRHATIWASRGGKWLALFHQGTPAATAAKMAASPAPKMAASPTPKK